METTEFQASIFDSIPYEKQAKDLVNYIDSIDNYKQVTMEMVEVYREQNLDRMDSLMHKSDPGMDEYMDLLLYGRNRHWVATNAGVDEKAMHFICSRSGAFTRQAGGNQFAASKRV